MKHNYLKSLLVMLLMCVGMGAWAESVTKTYTLNSSNNGNTVTTDDVSWQIGSGAITASSSNMKLTGTITVTLPAGATLTQVALTKSNTWGSGATVVFASGSTTLNTFSTDGSFSLNSHQTDCTYTFTKSGTSSKNAWVKTISVTYTVESGGSGSGDSGDPGQGGEDPDPVDNYKLANELDFTNATSDWGISTTKTDAENSYTCGSNTITLTGSTGEGYYYGTTTSALMLGKSGATLKLPAFPFAVKKIEVVGPASGASTNVSQNIYVGETAVSTETTNANGTHTFIIDENHQVIGTQYILKVTNDYNTQVKSIKIYADKEDANVPTYYNVTIANDIQNGKAIASGTSYITAGSQISLTAMPNIGYEFVSWNVTDASSNAVTVTDNTFTMPASNVTVSATFAAMANTKGYDMTTALTDQGAEVSSDNVTFTEIQYTLDFAKNGGTAVNNYIPAKNSNTRLYSKNKITITPKAGYVVKYLLASLSSSSPGQIAWSGGTKTNCTVTTGNASNGNPGWAKITPNDGAAACSLQLSNQTNIDAIIVVYDTKATITLNAACNDGKMVYGTFSCAQPWIVSSDLVVSEISIVDGALYVESYKPSDVVPANTGVMVSAPEGGEYKVNIETDPETIELAESVLGSENCLHPSSEAMTGEKLFYRLTMHNGNTIGFAWGAEEGAAFKLAEGKAYLAVPTSAGVKSLMWFNNDETAIKNVETKAENTMIFDLQGRKVSAAQKGLYIINGKKVVK